MSSIDVQHDGGSQVPTTCSPSEEDHATSKELRENYPKVWAIVSCSDGGTVQPKALASYLRSLGLKAVADAPPDDALNTLLAYARGDGGGLEVRPSSIEGAGLGLFATRAFGTGELLCVYWGTVVPFARVLRGEVRTDYLMGGFSGYSVDAAEHPQVLARYINDHADPAQLNAHFVKLRRERRALVLALRPIVAGEEVFAAYGEGYWRTRGERQGLLPNGGEGPDMQGVELVGDLSARGAEANGEASQGQDSGHSESQ